MSSAMSWKIYRRLLSVFVCLLLFFARPVLAKEINTLDDLAGAKVGGWPSLGEMRLKERYPDIKFTEMETIADMVQHVKQGKVDACILNYVFYNTLLEEGVDGVRLLPEPVAESPTGYLFANTPKGKKLGEQMDRFIRKCRRDGTLDRLTQKWMRGSKEGWVFEKPALSGKNGMLTAGSNAINMPFVYLENDKVTGFEVELFALFCAEYGYDYQVKLTSFESMLLGVESGQYDVGINAVEITKERGESFRLSEPTFTDETVVFVKDYTSATSYISSFKSRIVRTLITEDRWKMLAKGMGTTLLITLSATVMGTLLGFILCFVYRERNRWANTLIDLLSRFLQGMPVMVLLMLFYYVVFAGGRLSADVVAIVVFTLTTGIDVLGMLQSGTASVPKGQTEGGLALGYTERQTFRKFILPQAVRTFFPTWQASIVNLLKFTAIVGYISVQDLTRMADLIRARTYDAFMPLIVISILYMILAYLTMKLTGLLLTRLDPSRRRPEDILPGVKL